MDSFEVNKILMAIGFALLTVFGINELTKAIYDVPPPSGKAFIVQGVEEADAGGGAAAPAAEVMPDWGTVLPAANVAAGEKIAGKCLQCHNFAKGGPNGVGPNLYGIVGNHHAHLGDGFDYSSAMKAKSGEQWTYDDLFVFIGKPQKGVPGTKMGFPGLPKPEDRINVIAFLRQQSDSPLAIPAPNPAAAAPASAAPGEGGKPNPTAATPGGTPGKSEPAAPGTPPAKGKAAPNSGTPGNESQPQPATPSDKAGGSAPTSEPPKASPGPTPPQPAAEPAPAPPPPAAPAASPAPPSESPPNPGRVDANPPAGSHAEPGTAAPPPTEPGNPPH